jgi:hypothetical protein
LILNASRKKLERHLPKGHDQLLEFDASRRYKRKSAGGNILAQRDAEFGLTRKARTVEGGE